MGFPGSSEVKASACNVGDPGSIPGLGRFPWRRKWQPTPVFLPGESHGQTSLVGYSPRGRKESDKTEQLHFHFHFRFIIAFLPRSKRLLISWLQSWSTVILEHKKIKSITVSIVSPSICHEVMGSDAMVLVSLNLEFQGSFFNLRLHVRLEAL